jgi:hypothetical protein
MFHTIYRLAKNLLYTKKMLVSLGLTAPLVLSCASGHHTPFYDTVTPTRDTGALAERLKKAVSFSETLSMEEIGHVEYPGFRAPIWRVSHRPVQAPKRMILVNAGIHGNEPAGVECAIELVESIAGNPDMLSDIAVDVIPVINPWGWSHDNRFNRDGIDINRDLASSDSGEAKIVVSALEGKHYDLMLDLHEDPSAKGFYLYQYGLTEKTFSEKVVAAVHKMGYPIEQDVNMVVLKADNGIIDAPLWGLWYMRLTGQLSLANYYRLNISEHVFTIETPTNLPLADRTAIQRTVVQMFIQTYDRND